MVKKNLKIRIKHKFTELISEKRFCVVLGLFGSKSGVFERNREINWLMGYFGNKIASQNLGFKSVACLAHNGIGVMTIIRLPTYFNRITN